MEQAVEFPTECINAFWEDTLVCRRLHARVNVERVFVPLGFFFFHQFAASCFGACHGFVVLSIWSGHFCGRCGCRGGRSPTPSRAKRHQPLCRAGRVGSRNESFQIFLLVFCKLWIAHNLCSPVLSLRLASVSPKIKSERMEDIFFPLWMRFRYQMPSCVSPMRTAPISVSFSINNLR